MNETLSFTNLFIMFHKYIYIKQEEFLFIVLV